MKCEFFKVIFPWLLWCYHHHQQQTVKKVCKLLMQQLLCYWPVVNVIYHSPRIVSACLRVRQGRNAAGQILESCCRCRQLHKSFTFVTNKKSQILQYKDLNDSIYLDFLAFPLWWSWAEEFKCSINAEFLIRRLTCGNFLDGGMIWLSSSLSIVLDELPTRECWVLSPFELFSLLPLPFSIFLLFSLRFSLRLDGCEGLLSLLSLISLSLLTLSSSSSSIRLFLGLSGRISPFSILKLDKESMKTKHSLQI